MMLKLPVKSWVEIKKFILKICKKSKQCDGPTITNWGRTAKKIDKGLKENR